MSWTAIIRIVLNGLLLVPVWQYAHWSVALMLTLVSVRLELDNWLGWKRLR
jgi:hypothetical protein